MFGGPCRDSFWEVGLKEGVVKEMGLNWLVAAI